MLFICSFYWYILILGVNVMGINEINSLWRGVGADWRVLLPHKQETMACILHLANRGNQQILGASLPTWPGSRATPGALGQELGHLSPPGPRLTFLTPVGSGTSQFPFIFLF